MAQQTDLRRQVRVYLAEHGRTQFWLSQQLKISNSMLSLVLSGYRQLGPAAAQRLQKLTGIDIERRACS